MNIRFGKNTNTDKDHKETADKAETILNGPKKRCGVYRCTNCGTYYNPTNGKSCPGCGR